MYNEMEWNGMITGGELKKNKNKIQSIFVLVQNEKVFFRARNTKKK